MSAQTDIATDLTRIIDAKSDLKTSIEGKGVTVPSATKIDGYAALVDQIPQGSSNPEAGENDVIFIDYDGTIRYSYSKADFANLTALPANPSHTGLTAQGWNWALANAQSHVAAYGRLIIGQNYVTTDGKTRLYIVIDEDALLTVPLSFRQSAANGISVDWGDGSTAETFAGTGTINATHTYPKVGSYVIEMAVTSGNLYLGPQSGNNSVMGAAGNNYGASRGLLRKVEMGSSCGLAYSAFNSCNGLHSIAISTGILGYGFSTFTSCIALQAVVFPTAITSSQNNAFYGCSTLKYVSWPSTLTKLTQSALYNCVTARLLTIPSGVTEIGNTAIYGNYVLTTIRVPASVTTIGNNAFAYCYCLKALYMYPTVPPTIGTTILYQSPADVVIYVPNGKLATYQGASGWSAYSSQMVEMPA